MSHILITVDVEDWFQVENLRPHFPHQTWDSCEFRIEASTHKLLDLFDSIKIPSPTHEPRPMTYDLRAMTQHPIQATFFVLG